MLAHPCTVGCLLSSTSLFIPAFHTACADAVNMEFPLATDYISGSWGRLRHENVRSKNAQKSSRGNYSCKTHINDIPHPVLSIIFSLVRFARSRNAMALACREWYRLERSTRISLSLRGDIYSLHFLPLCFQSVTCLDMSNSSPWGYSPFKAQPSAVSTADWILQAFPNVKELTVYVRDAVDIQFFACMWPELEILRLVRWHQRAMEPEEAADAGMELHFVLKHCIHLRCLDLSRFYCWTEDIPPVIMSGLSVSQKLQSLNLLKLSPEGFKSEELAVIAMACVSLEELYVLCEFDPRYTDAVGDAALGLIAQNCRKLHVLHLVDSNEYNARRGDPDDGFAEQDTSITREGLETLFQALPNLQDLSLLLAQNFRDSAMVLEALASSCQKLRELKVSHFHGLCQGPMLHGLARCSNLKMLSIKHCADLSDAGLAEIARGCQCLTKLSLRNCREITKLGLENCMDRLTSTLVVVKVTCCRLLSTADILHSLKPIQGSLKRLEIDCLPGDKTTDSETQMTPMQDQYEASVSKSRNNDHCRNGIALKFPSPFCATRLDEFGDPSGETISLKFFQSCDDGVEDWEHTQERPSSKVLFPSRSKMSAQASNAMVPKDSSVTQISTQQPQNSLGSNCSDDSSSVISRKDRICQIVTRDDHPDGLVEQPNVVETNSWRHLTCLSLWIPVSGDLSMLPFMGLESCPDLQEINIRVEGDCRLLSKPPGRAWGLSYLAQCPALAKLKLDLSEVVGYALSAPSGYLDLSLWERYYLNGIQYLGLTEFDYWPPSDKDLNHRGLSLPGAGLLSECSSLRKLFVHGTTYEHLLFMLLRIPNLRDVQFREDYYPAPENEMSTEMRVDSCKRFEMALAKRGCPD